MSIRLRMALGVGVLVGVVLALVSVATYELLRSTLLADIERDVARRAQELSAQPTDGLDLDTFSAPDVFLQVLDAQGQPVASSGNLDGRVLPLDAGAEQGRVVEVHVEGRPLFLTAAPLADGGQVVVARSPRTTYGALRQLRGLLLPAVGVAVVVGAALTWLFAHVALRPVERVVAAARRVRAGRDLSQRVHHRGPADEVGRLAGTFNAMLAELERVYADLDRSNQRLRQFLADCAHELRTPLTLLMSNLDLLARVGADDEEFRDQALRDVRTEVERMARMITQLLILARAESGAQVQQEPVCLREIVDDACRQQQRMADHVDFVPGEHDALDGAVARGSPDYLRQVLLILIDNALKYTPPGGRVTVSSGVADGQARISVTDSGIGIFPDDLPHIFDRLYRGKNARTATGTGLGLAIAEWVATQHGGRIQVDTTPGTGSTFTLVLPLAAYAEVPQTADSG